MPDNPRFLATKGGTNQTLTDSVATKLTFTTEVFDTGNFYNSLTSIWTPPAGIIVVGANALVSSSSTVANSTCLLMIYKNGSEVARSLLATYTNLCGPSSVAFVDQCTGTDTYEIYSFYNSNATPPIASGSADLTRFWGEWIIASADATAAFRADKNGVNQTGFGRNTWITVTFPTERFDIGNDFAANTWTPPSGLVCMTASVGNLGTQPAGALGQSAIAKNGTRIGTGLKYAVSGDSSVNLVFIDQCSGADNYTVQSYNPATGGRQFSGLTTHTWFSGYWVPL